MSDQQRNEEGFSDVQFIEPNYALSKRIGKKLTDVFTVQRIEKASKQLAQVEDIFRDEALKHTKYFMELCEKNSSTELLLRTAVDVKSATSMAGFSWAAKFAELLVRLLKHADISEQETLAIAQTINQAIRAVISEDRRHMEDDTSAHVLQEISEHVQSCIQRQQSSA